MLDDWMASIPKGRIFLRDDRKKKTCLEGVEEFQISKYQVTQEIYKEVTGQNPSSFIGTENPVEGVSWLDAISFCNKLSESFNFSPCYKQVDTDVVELAKGANGFRLPTDAEWEFACRANVNKPQYGPVDEIAWYEGNSNSSTHPVGEKAPNGFGLFDMLGNVWEWCWDIYDAEVYGTYRVFRGGGWADCSRGFLATNRRRSHPTYGIDDLGFRIARSVP